MKLTAYPPSRVRGMLLGLHAGDCLGAPIEFEPARPREQWLRDITGGGEFRWRPGQGTDDTDLSLCVLAAIASPREFRAGVLREKLLAWFAGNPPDVGNTTKKSLLRLRQGVPIEESGVSADDTQSNGSLMRCAPLALLELAESELDGVVSLQAGSTHAHPRCRLADRALVHALQALLGGATRERAHGIALTVAAEDPVLAQALREAPAREWEELATSGSVVHTLAAGFWALLRRDTLEEALIAVVNRGDDADTCGAVAGALCGAFHGVEKIPARWLEKLEGRGEIERHLARIYGA